MGVGRTAVIFFPKVREVATRNKIANSQVLTFKNYFQGFTPWSPACTCLGRSSSFPLLSPFLWYTPPPSILPSLQGSLPLLGGLGKLAPVGDQSFPLSVEWEPLPLSEIGYQRFSSPFLGCPWDCRAEQPGGQTFCPLGGCASPPPLDCIKLRSLSQLDLDPWLRC